MAECCGGHFDELQRHIAYRNRGIDNHDHKYHNVDTKKYVKPHNCAATEESRFQIFDLIKDPSANVPVHWQVDMPIPGGVRMHMSILWVIKLYTFCSTLL